MRWLLLMGILLAGCASDSDTTTTTPLTTTTTTISAQGWTDHQLFDAEVDPHARRLDIPVSGARQMVFRVCADLDAGYAVLDVFLAYMEPVVEIYGIDNYPAGESAGFIFSTGVRIYCPDYGVELMRMFGDLGLLGSN